MIKYRRRKNVSKCVWTSRTSLQTSSKSRNTSPLALAVEIVLASYLRVAMETQPMGLKITTIR